MAKRYVVNLSEEEKEQLESMLRSGIERVRDRADVLTLRGF